MLEVIERVGTLEQTLQHFITVVERGFVKLQQGQDRIQALMEEGAVKSQESQARMDEGFVKQRESQDLLYARIEEGFAKQRESQALTEEQLRKSDIKIEKAIESFLIGIEQTKKENNMQWGKLSAKQGKMVEDLIHPSLPQIVEEYLGLEIDDLMIRRKKRLPNGNRKEYDAIAVTSSFVFLNSTKSSLNDKDVDALIDDLNGFKEVFPEFKALKLIGIIASLFVDENVFTYAERKGLMVLAVGGDLMEVVNSKGFTPRQW
ncbi:MAG: hypothetical protein HQL06_04990 [Nitrospirae bacterium]|nr:hypothetical protein [Nitrospirota bacterium]